MANVIIDKPALICLRDKRLLCTRSKGKRLFYVPGGKRNPGETDEVALRREIKEELGVEIITSSLRPLYVLQDQADGQPRGTMVKLTCYAGEYSGEARASSEIEEVAWLSYSDRDKLPSLGQQILDLLRERELV